MRVQNFNKGIRLTCTREEFIQLRIALAERKLSLGSTLRGSVPGGEVCRPVFDQAYDVCSDMFEEMVQI